MREAILKTVSSSQALIQSAGKYFPNWGTLSRKKKKKITGNSFQRLGSLNIKGKKVQRVILFSNFILKYKQDSLGLCQHNSLMYVCFQIPNMKVINIRLETADIWSKLNSTQNFFFNYQLHETSNSPVQGFCITRLIKELYNYQNLEGQKRQ